MFSDFRLTCNKWDVMCNVKSFKGLILIDRYGHSILLPEEIILKNKVWFPDVILVGTKSSFIQKRQCSINLLDYLQKLEQFYTQ